jgi:hypothetical protein
MSFEIALRTRAKSPAVMAIAKSVEWVKRPQGGAYPAIVLQVVSAPMAQTMKAFQAKQYARVQIDVFALDAAAKAAARDAVIAALERREAVGGIAFERIRDVSVRDLSEQGDTQFIHRDSIDAVFWFKTEE